MSGLVTAMLDVFAAAATVGVTAAAGGAIRVEANGGPGALANVAKASPKALTDGGPGTTT